MAMSWWPRPQPCNHGEILTQLGTIQESLRDLHRKADNLMAASDDIAAAVAALQSEETGVAATAADLTTAAANIQAELAALAAANPSVDTTALNAAVAGLAPVQQQLTAAQSAVDALETPPAPPPSS
jgi:predicted negative regulator of RcsB-dependent stress response